MAIEPPRVNVSAEQKGNEWVFAVSDNGIGIDPQYDDRIFVIFQRCTPEKSIPAQESAWLSAKRSSSVTVGISGWSRNSGAEATFYFTLPIRKDAP